MATTLIVIEPRLKPEPSAASREAGLLGTKV